MEKVITVETMRKSDAYTIANYIDSKSLMYKAGVGVFNSYSWEGDTVAIVCGTGNNAGDGYVLALLLKEKGIKTKLFLIKEKFSEDGRYYFDKCLKENISYEICSDTTDFSEYTVIVDCIFGTGFKGRPRGISQEIIGKINNSLAYIISVDINSGVNGDTGMAEIGVVSDLTVSIGYYKTGHFINDAPKYIKKCVNCDIGIELVGECFYLGGITKNEMKGAKFFKDYNSFVEENSCPTTNPVLSVNLYTRESKDKIFIENMGQYSLLSEKDKTILVAKVK